MKQKTIRFASTTVKVASIITGLAAYSHVIPERFAPVALIAFAIVSAIKDAAISAGDIADDGQRNNSFKP